MKHTKYVYKSVAISVAFAWKGTLHKNEYFYEGAVQRPLRPSRGDRGCLGPRPAQCSTTITLCAHLSHLNIAVHKLGEAHQICLQICCHIGSICLERHVTQKQILLRGCSAEATEAVPGQPRLPGPAARSVDTYTCGYSFRPPPLSPMYNMCCT